MRWREANREERQIAWLWGVVAVSSIALRPIWLAAAPFMPTCPFRAITGVPCLTCGSTHAATALLGGHVGAALSFNPLATTVAVAFLAGGVLAPIWAALGGRFPEFGGSPSRAARLTVAVVLLANWVWVIWRG